MTNETTQMLYGLAGYPLGHSFSRKYFTEKFERECIDAAYVNFELPDITLLPEVLHRYPNLRGFNVTIPYKQAVIPFLTRLDPVAEAIGAVNVVKVEDDGTLTGFNSDVEGFINAIWPMLTPACRRALVLGTGGASRAVSYGLRSLNLEVTRVSRRSIDGGLTYSEVTPAVIADHNLIVNATPLGMSPNVDDCPDIPYQALTPAHVCFDLVYNPVETLFMKKAAQMGAKTQNGLKMLYGQAEAAWRIWNGKSTDFGYVEENR